MEGNFPFSERKLHVSFFSNLNAKRFWFFLLKDMLFSTLIHKEFGAFNPKETKISTGGKGRELAC